MVLAGTGAIIINDFTGKVNQVYIATVFGLVVSAVIYSTGNISGAHINPAVTFGFWLAKRLPGKTLLPYIISQISGAMLASLSLKLLFPSHTTLGSTIPAISTSKAFGIEIILTFLLMFVIIRASALPREKSIVAGIAVGATVGIGALFAGPITGGSMNPARSLAPALISGHLEQLWIYLIAPFVGAILAITTCRATRNNCCV